ncbi:PREDICTED: ribosyldihydronicotinamide dehydrogenase [quinone] [Chrysochloris asiatica]|uniref:Ribosyldihydronicotinamide dehydrogenase [quinone] n=1 Tax=Chrysochloris asiatica TaxID=185453 RepID=A0A9B0TUP8_CHRAS|nr:PREDICTED: ribosyldihydronicotinamide dehydrogenase [quinone] [Chrysochloris asiatica]
MVIGRKVLMVCAHQAPSSLDGSLKEVAEDQLSRQGCTVTVSDLYTMDFERRATGEPVTCFSPGACSNPEVFSYGVEAYEACKKRSLARDIIDEQKKVQEADLVIFQFPLHWFSVPAILKRWMDQVLRQGFAYKTTDSGRIPLLQGKLAVSLTRGNHMWNDMKNTVSADLQAYLWPLPHGVLHLCGFKVLAPQISSALEFTSKEERQGMVTSWTERLKTIWTEEPIKPRCTFKP